mgnify:CR=1 FL=1
MLKPKLSPFKTLHKSQNALLVKTKLCMIACIYCPPSSQLIVDEISLCLSKISNQDIVILAGDLNCRIDKPQQKTRTVLDYLQTEGSR